MMMMMMMMMMITMIKRRGKQNEKKDRYGNENGDEKPQLQEVTYATYQPMINYRVEFPNKHLFYLSARWFPSLVQ